ncbi:MAG TPA: winged helix-turn-helix domain-containing protein [Pyrinomonadaceae bacterium]|nr:winged helix-turn-helix domain-containing protein [Pyrinomonadaceae bacterium]
MSEEGEKMYYQAGPYRLYPAARVLVCGDTVAKLTHKRYDILLILLRCAARVVGTEELRDAIWADESVEKSNLNVNITEIRKALNEACEGGAKLIKNYPRVGYRFMAPVEEHGIQMTAAVLPFRLEGSLKASGHIGQEMADTLTTMLNKNMSVLVTPSPTVYKEYNLHPEQSPLIFGHRLVVDYVFSGRIWRERDRIHVNVDLLNVRANEVTESSSFEGDHAESFELDKRIHGWMESALKLTPTEVEAAQSKKQYTKNRKASESYKKGRLQRFDVTEPSLKKAIKYFEHAVAEDPDFARAHANIADTYVFMGMLNLVGPQESYLGARDAARKAREKDERMASAHSAWAFVKLFFEWEWEEARAGFERAVEINPNYPVAHMGLAHWHAARGHEAEAEAEIDLALSLDPYSFFTNFVRGMVSFHARRYEQALAQFERTQELNLRFNLKSDLSHYGSSIALEQLALAAAGAERERLFRKAEGEARLAGTLSDRHPMKLLNRARINLSWGRTETALKLLKAAYRRRRAGNYVSQFHKAMFYAAAGKVNRAFKALDKAYEDRDQYLFTLRVEHRLNCLRDDPRFGDFLKRLGL